MKLVNMPPYLFDLGGSFSSVRGKNTAYSYWFEGCTKASVSFTRVIKFFAFSETNMNEGTSGVCGFSQSKTED